MTEWRWMVRVSEAVFFIMLFLLLPSTGQGIKVSRDDSIQSLSTDWWPTECHDAMHTGYSTTTIPDNVTMKWNATTTGFMESSPSIVDGRVFVTTAVFSPMGGFVYCYDMKDGARLWTFNGHDEFFASPTVVNDRVYACSLNGYCYCLVASTGEKLWQVKLGSHLIFERTCPVAVDGRLFLCSYKDDGSYNGSIFCVDAENGSVIWQISPGNNRDYALAVADGKVYGAGLNNQLSCFDAEDGDLLWVCTGVQMSTQASVMNDSVFVGTQDGRICCVADGDIQWQYQASASDLVTIPLAIAYGHVYSGLYTPTISLPDTILCLDAQTGDKEWSYILEDQGGVGYMPAVADGKVIILSSYGYDYPPDFDRMVKMYCLDALSGNLLWTFDHVGQGVDVYAYNSPGLADGNIFVCTTERDGSTDWGGLYCLGKTEYSAPVVEVIKPENALYINNRRMLSLRSPVILGAIDIEVNATDNLSGINRVEFYIDDVFVGNDTVAPYAWNWTKRTPFHWNHEVKVIAFNNAGNSTMAEVAVRKFL